MCARLIGPALHFDDLHVGPVVEAHVVDTAQRAEQLIVGLVAERDRVVGDVGAGKSTPTAAPSRAVGHGRHGTGRPASTAPPPASSFSVGPTSAAISAALGRHMWHDLPENSRAGNRVCRIARAKRPRAHSDRQPPKVIATAWGESPHPPSGPSGPPPGPFRQDCRLSSKAAASSGWTLAYTRVPVWAVDIQMGSGLWPSAGVKSWTGRAGKTGRHGATMPPIPPTLLASTGRGQSRRIALARVVARKPYLARGIH